VNPYNVTIQPLPMPKTQIFFMQTEFGFQYRQVCPTCDELSELPGDIVRRRAGTLCAIVACDDCSLQFIAKCDETPTVETMSKIHVERMQ